MAYARWSALERIDRQAVARPGRQGLAVRGALLARGTYVATLLALLGLASLLHVLFAMRAPLSNDESWYVQSGYQYAQDLRAGHPGAILHDRLVAEHPAFTRLLYAGAILIDWRINGYQAIPAAQQERSYQQRFAESPIFARYQRDARLVASLFGVALVLVLGLYSLPAGVFALCSTIVITFTTASYLEAPGMCFAALAMLIYVRARDRDDPTGALFLAGAAVGLAAAAKYYYVLAGVAILIDWLLAGRAPLRRRLAAVLAASAMAGLAFTLADPPFWTVGIDRAAHLLHANGVTYASGWIQRSRTYHTHWYSEVSILVRGMASWFPVHPSPFAIDVDPLIMALAALGLAVGGRRHMAIALWLLLTIGFLLIYPVKYVQYTSLAIAPICACAALGATWLWSRAARWLPRRAAA